MDQTIITVNESCELPIETGIVEVDTSNSSITIFMKSTPKSDDTLTIVKITNDNNTISLFSDSTLINDAEITIFGLPNNSKFSKGKNKRLILKSDGTNWKIISEQ